MKKIAKLLMVGLLAISLVLTGVLVACSPDEDPPGPGPIGGGEVEITDGRWSWDGEGFSVSLKLKEDGTFYMSVFMEGNETAGTWEIKDQEKQYYKIVEGSVPAEGDDQTEYTAPQTLILTAYNGTVYEAAYADNTFWNCNFPGMGSRTLTQDADYEWNPSEDEKNTVEVVRASLPKDANATLILIHDKTFEDAINNESGTWEKTESGYTLKKNDGAAYGTVASSEAGIYTLTLENGTVIDLYVTAWTPVYTLSATKVSATIGGEAVEGDATLRLWEDKSADFIYTVQGDYSVEIYDLVSGTYTENSDGTVTMTFGGTNVTTTAPDAQGNFNATVTVAAGDVLDEDLTVTVTGEAGATVYTGTVVKGESSTLPSVVEIVDNAAQMVMTKNGTYQVIGHVNASMMGVSNGLVVFATGEYTDDYAFTYTDAEGKEQTVSPVLADGEQGAKILNVTFTNLKMDASAIAPDAEFNIESVTITLGDVSNFPTAGDYVTQDMTETYTDSQNIIVNSATLFMKDGKFAVTFNVTVPAMQNATMNMVAWAGTYAESEGEVVFTCADETEFSSVEGAVDFTGFTVPGLGADVNFSFDIEKKIVPAEGEIMRFVTKEDITASGIPMVDTATTSVTTILFDNGTVELSVNIFGNKVVVDTGTYEIATGMIPTITFDFEIAGSIAASPDYEAATSESVEFYFEYEADAVSIAALGFNISFTATLYGTYVIA